MDKFFNDLTNGFIDDDKQIDEDPDQGELKSFRKLTRVPTQSTKYPTSK